MTTQCAIDSCCSPTNHGMGGGFDSNSRPARDTMRTALLPALKYGPPHPTMESEGESPGSIYGCIADHHAPILTFLRLREMMSGVAKMTSRLTMVGVAALVALNGAVQAQQHPSATAVATRAGSEISDDYLIGPEDVLEVSVWKEEALKKEILVRPDGGMSFPLVGDIRAAGKSAAQLQRELVTRLQKYIPDPVVSVAVLKINNNKIYVMGQVAKPGEYVTGRYVDVLQALSMAGGLTPFAAENRIKVIRKEEGKDVVFPFEYGKVQKGMALEQNIRLRSGDTVVVP